MATEVKVDILAWHEAGHEPGDCRQDVGLCGFRSGLISNQAIVLALRIELLELCLDIESIIDTTVEFIRCACIVYPD